MARLRIHYTEDEIITDLYTFGKEYMDEYNNEYIGLYHRYATNEIYTEPVWSPSLSKKLIPYENVNSPDFYYRKHIDINFKFKHFNNYIPTISYDSYKLGYIYRYFLKKNNENVIIEVNEDSYNQSLAQEIDPVLYSHIKIIWYISGQLETITKNNVIIYGVYDKNRNTIIMSENKMHGLSNKITNFTEFYLDTTFTVPKDINS